MKEQKETGKRKNILAFTLWGAIGFGIGGVIAGIIIHYAGDAAFWWAFILMLGIGGMSLGLALNSWGLALRLAAISVVTFLAGILVGLLGAFGPTGPGDDPLRVGLAFAISGAVTGFGLGMAGLGWYWNRGRVDSYFMGLVMALAGAIGFGIIPALGTPGGADFWKFPDSLQWLESAVAMAIWGSVIGVFLGAALGYLEKRKAMQNTKS